jgi:putative transposase
MTNLVQSYPTDLKYSQWELIVDLFPPDNTGRGRHNTWPKWQIVNAILYVNRTGCQWRMLPTTFPPWSTVYGYYWRWTHAGLWEQINTRLVKTVRVQQGRADQPSAAVLDSQSVKTSEGGEQRGVDVYKQTNGRKRHVLVDTLGLMLMVVVTSASVQDGAGALGLLQRYFERVKHSVYNRWCRLKLIWADGAYAHTVDEVRRRFGWQVSVIQRPENVKGFVVLPKRWVVERTFGWLGRYRRLARDYEHTVASSQAMVYLASTRRMLKLAAK